MHVVIDAIIFQDRFIVRKIRDNSADSRIGA